MFLSFAQRKGKLRLFCLASNERTYAPTTICHQELPSCLQECIRNRFRVALWKDLHTVGNVVRRTDVTISEWMKAHGIEDNDRNWNTIAKILQRKRAVYCKDGKLRNKNSDKKVKSGKKTTPPQR